MPRRSVKSKGVNLLEVLGELSPRLMSNGQVRCECPFRENHTDGSGKMSFYATPQINAYHCFSCGAKGRLVSLLTNRFGVNYFEAMDSVRLTDYVKEKEDFELDVVWDFKDPPKEFLRKGFSKETLKYFRVGTSSDGSILIPYYSDFTKKTCLLGYQKRWYEPNRRVLNSKGFDKSEYLYNLDHSYSYVVLVEGQSDVWRVHQYGYNACALMGSSISTWQVEQLSKFDRVYLALDNDLAGRKATEFCYHHLKNYTDVRLIPYQSDDPGDCLSKTDWVSAFESNTDYMEYSLMMSIEWDEYLDLRDEVSRAIWNSRYK